MPKDLTIAAVGDIFVDHERVGRGDPDSVFDGCRKAIQAADISFFNCEGLYSTRDVTIPMQGFAWNADPRAFAPVRAAGFDVAGVANNHALDLGAEGLMDNIQVLHEHDIQVCGGGENLAAARRPAVVERNGVTVAFLAYNCVGPREFSARANRAGVAAVEVSTLYEPIEHQPGTPARILTFADRDDLAGMVADITEAKKHADIVIPNFHWGMHHVQAMLCMYQQEIAYAAIDAGADLVLGGHDHVMKGMEVYKGTRIFYGLGDFVMDLPITQRTQTPWRKMKEYLYDLEYDPTYPTYPFPPEARYHAIVQCRVRDGKVDRVSFLPCDIDVSGAPRILTQGQPEFSDTVNYLQAISEHQGLNARFEIDGDEVVLADPVGLSTPMSATYQRFALPGLEAGPRPASLPRPDTTAGAPRL